MTEGLAQMGKIVKSLLGRADCAPFKEVQHLLAFQRKIRNFVINFLGMLLLLSTNYVLVHKARPMERYEAVGLPKDYHKTSKVIKVPMDLGTVSKKLESKVYKNATECASDIRLIWSNCKLYNQEGSEFFDLATQLERRFEGRFSSVPNPNECVPGFPEGGKLNDKMTPLDEKMKFCFALYRMSRESLGRLIVRLEQICPEAIERIGEEDIELNVDTMSYSVFTEMQNLAVKDPQLDTSVNNKRRKKGGSSGGGKANRTRS